MVKCMKSKLMIALTVSIWVIAVAKIEFAATRSDDDSAAISLTRESACKAVEALDHVGAMGPFQNRPGFLLFDFTPPRGKDYAKLDKDNVGFIDSSVGKPLCRYLEIYPVLLSNDAAYS
jgi:hypothetical protein